MSDKYSSDKGLQKLFEGFRSHTEEAQEVQQLDEEQLDEGLMDTLNYLFTGKTPSELELIQRELDKAHAKAKKQLSKPSIKGGDSPETKTARMDAKLKLAKLKKARGMPITEMYGGMSPEHTMINDKIFEVVDLLHSHGSDSELSDSYIALFRALDEAGVNLRFIMMSV